MNTSYLNTLVGMNALQQRMDVISHNVANLNTDGYKRREATFSALFTRELQNQSDANREEGRVTPYGIRPGSGARLGMTRLDLTPGVVRDTGVSTHLMLEGPVFFMTRHNLSDDPANREYEYRLTRNGAFKLDAYGYLVNDQGDYVLDAEQDPVQVQQGYEFRVINRADGQAYIQFVNPKDPLDVIDPNIQLGIYYVQNPQILKSVGNHQFTLPDEFLDEAGQVDPAGNEYIDIMTGANAVVAVEGVEWGVQQGKLEGSNVDLTKEMTDLLETQRTFQMSSRALYITDQMIGMANNLRG